MRPRKFVYIYCITSNILASKYGYEKCTESGMDIGQKNLTFHIYVEQPGKFCCDNGHCIDSEFRYGIKTIYSKGCSKKNGEW